MNRLASFALLALLAAPARPAYEGKVPWNPDPAAAAAEAAKAGAPAFVWIHHDT